MTKKSFLLSLFLENKVGSILIDNLFRSDFYPEYHVENGGATAIDLKKSSLLLEVKPDLLHTHLRAALYCVVVANGR